MRRHATLVPVDHTIPIAQRQYGQQTAGRSIFQRRVYVGGGPVPQVPTMTVVQAAPAALPSSDVPRPILPAPSGSDLVPVDRQIPIGVRGGVPSGTSIFGGPVYAEDALSPLQFAGFGCAPDGLGRYR